MESVLPLPPLPHGLERRGGVEGGGGGTGGEGKGRGGERKESERVGEQWKSVKEKE